MSHTSFCRWSCWWVVGGFVALGTVAALSSRALGQETPASTPAKSVKARPLFGGNKKIFWLGDSTSVGDKSKGGRVVGKLEDAGYIVEKNALGGRSANSFIAGSKGLKEPAKGLDQLDDMIAAFGPDMAIIDLNTNDLAGISLPEGKRASLKVTTKNFQKIVNKLEDNGVRVIGLGAPHYKERPSFHPHEERLKKALVSVYGEDNFIDTAPITGSYKMHGAGKGAEEFAEKIYAELTNIL